MSPAPNAHASGGAALPKPPSDKQLDIHHISTLPLLARTLHRSLFTAPGPFKSVQDGLALLIVALETAETAALAADSSDLHASIEKELQGCDETLLALRKLKRQYNVGDSQSEADQTPVNEETTKELEELREKLTSYTSTLNLLNANTVRSSEEHVQRTTKAFIQEVRSGKRDKSVVSTNALSIGNADGWKQLRKELQSAGVNAESFAQNFELVVAALKESEFGDNIPDLDHINPYYIDAAQSGLSYGQVKDMATNMASAWMGQISEYASSPRWNSIGNQSMQAFAGLKIQPTHVGHMFSKAMGNRKDLVSCAEDGDLTMVMHHLKRGANINTITEGESALSRAAANGHKEIVLLLFAKGADLDAVNPQGETPFVQAAKNGHREIVQILLSHAESVAKGRHGEEALKKAAESGHEEIVHMLLEKGVNADVLDPDDRNDNTALSKAASKGHEKIVVMLLNHGVRINVTNYWGETALYHAIAYGDRKIIHHLLKFDVDVDPRAEHRAQENARLFGWLKAEQRAREKGLLGSVPRSPAPAECQTAENSQS